MQLSNIIRKKDLGKIKSNNPDDLNQCNRKIAAPNLLNKYR